MTCSLSIIFIAKCISPPKGIFIPPCHGFYEGYTYSAKKIFSQEEKCFYEVYFLGDFGCCAKMNEAKFFEYFIEVSEHRNVLQERKEIIKSRKKADAL